MPNQLLLGLVNHMKKRFNARGPWGCQLTLYPCATGDFVCLSKGFFGEGGGRGGARGVAPSNYKSKVSDKDGRQTHEPRVSYDFVGIEGQIWVTDRLEEVHSSSTRGIGFLAQCETGAPES